MNKPTFIAVPIEGLDGRTVWINAETITSFGEKYDGTAVIVTSDGSSFELTITIGELVHILRAVGCRLLTIDDIDDIYFSEREDI